MAEKVGEISPFMRFFRISTKFIRSIISGPKWHLLLEHY